MTVSILWRRWRRVKWNTPKLSEIAMCAYHLRYGICIIDAFYMIKSLVTCIKWDIMPHIVWHDVMWCDVTMCCSKQYWAATYLQFVVNTQDKQRTLPQYIVYTYIPYLWSLPKQHMANAWLWIKSIVCVVYGTYGNVNSSKFSHFHANALNIRRETHETAFISCRCP